MKDPRTTDQTRTLDMASGDADRLPPLATVALLVAALLFAVNHAVNHLWQLPGGRYGYSVVVVLLIGTVVPCAVLVTLARRGVIDLHRWGYALAPVELLKIALGLVLGGAIASLQIGAAVWPIPPMPRCCSSG